MTQKTTKITPVITTSIRFPAHLDAEAAELCAMFMDTHNMAVSKNSILSRSIEIGLPIIRDSIEQKPEVK